MRSKSAQNFTYGVYRRLIILPLSLISIRSPPLLMRFLSSEVSVRRLSDGQSERAWVYHRRNPLTNVPIEGGDWVEWLRKNPERHPKAAALHYVPHN